MMVVFVVLVLFTCLVMWTWLNPFLLIYTQFREQLSDLKFVNNTFTVVQFADLHFGESDEEDYNSLVGMRHILAAESNVNLVIFTGDQVTGDEIQSVTKLKEKWIESLSVAGEYGVPFVSLFGNHDDRPYGFNPSEAFQWSIYLIIFMSILLLLSVFIMVYTAKFKWFVIALLVLCVATLVAGYFITSPSRKIREHLHRHEANVYPRLSYSSPIDFNIYNFFIPLVANGSVVFRILVLDSGGGRIPYGVTGSYSDWLSNSPASSDATDKEFIAFFHVPTPEFKVVVEADTKSASCFGELNTEPNNENFNGVLGDLRDLKTRAVFVGHDHGNDWCCTSLKLPSLCYGRHTGFGGYGNWPRGARVVKLVLGEDDNVKIETWLRMADGSKLNNGFI